MTSGGLGTMSYGLPAALGAVAHPDSLVIDITERQRQLQMTMQEMATVQYNAPIKIFILNNQYAV